MIIAVYFLQRYTCHMYIYIYIIYVYVLVFSHSHVHPPQDHPVFHPFHHPRYRRRTFTWQGEVVDLRMHFTVFV